MTRLTTLLLVWSTMSVSGLTAQELAVEGPEVILANVPVQLQVTAAPGAVVTVRGADGTVLGTGEATPAGTVPLTPFRVSADQIPLRVQTAGTSVDVEAPVFPGWVSLLPPLAAIGLAFVLREVVTSLFVGIWLGAMFFVDFNPVAAVFTSANRFARSELGDPDNASILLFSLMLGGMVGLMTRMGGTRAIVDAVAPLARTRRSGLLATWLAGLAVFFDDYSNTLIVGNTMRPLTDRLRISREKLAYIVDSTAAPVAALFFVSTWIGYEVGLIDDGLGIAAAQSTDAPQLAAALTATSPFGVFLQTIPFLFYPLFAIFLVALLAATGRDFGPMLTAERRASAGGGLHRVGAQLAADMSGDLREKEGLPSGRWWNGALPVATLVFTVLYGLVRTGLENIGPDGARGLREIFGNADPFGPLVWGSALGCVVAVVLSVTQRLTTVEEAIQSWLSGLRAMLLAVVILILAWSLGKVTQDLGTPGYLAQILSDTLPRVLLPTLVFVVAAVMAFATGTSWATMAILLPLVVPLAIALVGSIDPAGAADRAVVFGSIGSVLAGAIFGDHCSPISDTTVMSSMASSCDHVDHVRTQMPYALLVGVVALLCGSVLSAIGVAVWICLALGVGVLVTLVMLVGKDATAPIQASSSDA